MGTPRQQKSANGKQWVNWLSQLWGPPQDVNKRLQRSVNVKLPVDLRDAFIELVNSRKEANLSDIPPAAGS